nr:GNAT family N-acetyltransferase [Halorarius litoreus]
MDARIGDADGRLYVAEHEGAPVGFVEFDADGVVRWLHVDLDARGQGAGTALVKHVQAELADRGDPLGVRVLQAAGEGRGFLERFGLTEVGTVSLTFDEERFTEVVYADETSAPRVAGVVGVPETLRVDGETLQVDESEPVPGTEGLFFPVSESTADRSPWGFVCSRCGSTAVAADGLDRLVCDDCGNTHLADQWDEAYL